ncbi:hypothetical protein DFQ28_008604 [Apophysomyces sp. BC1034]|nr:hypothetical protein DFQ30_006910 [Apophysomyces sp. BC1015]KAG0173050.1 hypothetical protein DFQ29_008124 [Apophysomyces sp. BC1021]KAG0192606.1 hypothetical protein DFQ28_008604 [Apophysomyces sp. BC1034]
MLTRYLFFVASSSLFAYVNAYGQIAQVVDATNFCVFLPPEDSQDRIISNTEWNAQAFCMGNTPKATNAGKIPEGFIKSAHYVATDQYVQITGQIDPAKARLDPKDDGGQYDIKAPNGSSCAGWQFYVNLIEPTTNTWCMRCCNDKRTCNRGISEKGCQHIIPGDYSGPMDGSGSAPSAKPTITTVATTPSPTTPTQQSNTTTVATTITTTTTTVKSRPTPNKSANPSLSSSVTSASTSSSASPSAALPSSSHAVEGNTSPASSGNTSGTTSSIEPAGKSTAVVPNELDQEAITAQSVNGASELLSPLVYTFAGLLISLGFSA